jgi:hypothetical protein
MTDNEAHGFRRIGSLIPSNSPLPQNAGSMPERRSNASGITGSRSPGSKGANAIGARHGATGAVARPDLTRDDWERDPRETTAALVALLPLSVRQQLRAHYEDRVDPEFGWDGEVAGYSIKDAIAEDAQAEARALIEPAIRPIEDEQVWSELGRLRASCKARPETLEEQSLVWRVLAEECAEYPADVVVHVLRAWARRETFTPSLAELRARLQRASRSRLSLVTAVSNPTSIKRSA